MAKTEKAISDDELWEWMKDKNGVFLVADKDTEGEFDEEENPLEAWRLDRMERIKKHKEEKTLSKEELDSAEGLMAMLNKFGTVFKDGFGTGGNHPENKDKKNHRFKLADYEPVDEKDDDLLDADFALFDGNTEKLGEQFDDIGQMNAFALVPGYGIWSDCLNYNVMSVVG